MKIKYCFFVGLVALGASAASAMGLGQNANETPVVNPATQESTEVWKLAGYAILNGGQYKMVGGVQISPGWIMVSWHSQPPLGTYFANGFGTARVELCLKHTHGIDATICKLQRAFKMPAGFVFPPLVENPDVLAKGRSPETLAKDLGQFLAISYGMPILGEPIFAWTDFVSMRLDSDVAVLKEGDAPYVGDKDSGSPIFWFSSRARKVGLMATRSSRGSVGPWGIHKGSLSFAKEPNNARFTMPFLEWVSKEVSDRSSDRVQTLSALGFHGEVTPTPQWVGLNGREFISSTPTSVTLGWSMPSAYSADVQKYLVQVIRDGQSVSGAFVGAATNKYSFVGLLPNVNYIACVTPVGRGGPAPMGVGIHNEYIVDGTYITSWSNEHSCSAFKLHPAPTAISKLAVGVVPRKFASGIYDSPQATWSRPTSPSLPTDIRYRVYATLNGTVIHNGIADSGTSQWLWGGVEVVSGDNYCVTVTPFTEPAAYGPTSKVCRTY